MLRERIGEDAARVVDTALRPGGDGASRNSVTDPAAAADAELAVRLAYDDVRFGEDSAMAAANIA